MTTLNLLRADGWTDLQVEETDANYNGFEVLYYNESWTAMVDTCHIDLMQQANIKL